MCNKYFYRVLLIYTGVALFITFPVILHLNSRILGAPYSDIYTHIWNIWQVKKALLEDKVFPLYVDSINFPQGKLLFPASLLNAVISIPFQLLWGIVAAINIIIIFNLSLGALGAFCLSYYLIRDSKVSFIAGLIYGFSPFVLSFCVASGGVEGMSIGWPPLFFLFSIRSLCERGLKNPLLAAIFLFLTLISCLYYAILCMFFFGILLLYFFLVVRDKREDLIMVFFEEKNTESVKTNKNLIGRLISGVTISLILCLPIILTIYYSVNSADSILPLEMVNSRLGDTKGPVFSPELSANHHCIAFLEDYFLPGKDNLIVSSEISVFYQTVYCGYIVLLFSILSFFSFKRKMIYFFAVSVVLFMFLSIGPHLAISRKYFFLKPVSPLYTIIYSVLPSFKGAMIVNRFVLIVMLCLSILAAAGVRVVIVRLKIKHTLFFVGLISGLILFEVLFVSPLVFPLPSFEKKIPDVYRKLSEEKERFGILELPFFIKSTNLMPRERFYYQIIHRKPIADIVAGELPDYIKQNPFTKELFLYERGKYDFINPFNEEKGNVLEGFRQLARDGFRYIIVHREYYKSQAWEEVNGLLEAFMGAGEECHDGIVLFKIKEEAVR